MTTTSTSTTNQHHHACAAAIDPTLRSIKSTAAIRKALCDGRDVDALIFDEGIGSRLLPVGR